MSETMSEQTDRAVEYYDRIQGYGQEDKPESKSRWDDEDYLSPSREDVE